MSIDPSAPPSGTGCLECEKDGGWWFHLRRCGECGHVGCCDSSPSQHATAHWRETGHALMRSFEPGEDWWWDFDASASATGPELAEPQHRPLDQSAPGPVDRVPDNWQSLLH
ncbi:UBP-type zinc finger domain-containing protein [Cellulomonas sp. PhB150]|uniref:UBP-type zinc finger domain-containing protein n=1 Tax=Cellulomonas sp. PhB150 TaxID=2485188 RepID=UPI000F4A1B57|nr:UBP-type zinc finger domain-containing protein [Cellulomonas sp. PhB150]ROS30805.1 ubiquitin-hydrolase Zn-finger-containing protein [Cellulomonas sp. PhB150]